MPHGSTITGVTCTVLDDSATYFVYAGLAKRTFATGGLAIASGWLQTAADRASPQALSNTGLGEVVDNAAAAFFVFYQPSDPTCDASCKLYGCSVRYTITQPQ